MAEFKKGNVILQIPDHLVPPEKAGNLSGSEVLRTPKARTGVSGACFEAAHDLEQVEKGFIPPAEVTADSLREAGKKAEAIDQTIRDLEVMLLVLTQSRLLLLAEADKQLRQLNDQVKAQGKHRPEFLTRFKELIAFFKKPRKEKTEKTEKVLEKVGTSD